MNSILPFIEGLFGFKLLNRECEICGDVDADLFCLHRCLCVECGGASIINCQECNPENRLYIVDRDWFGSRIIKFLD